MNIAPSVVQQLLLLPKNALFVVCGIQNLDETKKFVASMGRRDVKCTSEYGFEDMQWVLQPPTPVVVDNGFKSESVWKSPRFLVAHEVARQLGRLK